MVSVKKPIPLVYVYILYFLLGIIYIPHGGISAISLKRPLPSPSLKKFYFPFILFITKEGDNVFIKGMGNSPPFLF